MSKAVNLHSMNTIDQYLLYVKLKWPFMYHMLVNHRTHKREKIRFPGLWYLEGIYKDENPNIVLKKSTQSGISEMLIGKALHHSVIGLNVLYVLPTEILKARFVAGRVDKTLEAAPYYYEQQIRMNSTSMKSFGDGIINFIGSNSPSGFTEFVANTVIMDEMDRCNQENLAMAVERQSQQTEKYMIKNSNPTIEGFAIDEEYNNSDMKVWLVDCDHCGHEFEFDFFKNIVRQIDDKDYVLRDKDFEWGSDRDIKVLCEKCDREVDRFKRGRWASRRKSNVSGYTISKIFSTKVTVREIVGRFMKGLKDETTLERFYNGDLGLAYSSSGAKVLPQVLDQCIRDFSRLDRCGQACIMGVDVGTNLNVVIGRLKETDEGQKIEIVFLGELRDESQIYDLHRLFNIVCSVFDSRPETRMVRRILANVKQAWMADYLTGSTSDGYNVDVKRYSTDRTTSMDGVKEAIMTEYVLLPRDAKSVKGFYEQMTAPTRVWQPISRNGVATNEGRYVWTEGGRPDHYYHAMNYMLMAKKLITVLR